MIIQMLVLHRDNKKYCFCCCVLRLLLFFCGGSSLSRKSKATGLNKFKSRKTLTNQGRHDRLKGRKHNIKDLHLIICRRTLVVTLRASWDRLSGVSPRGYSAPSWGWNNGARSGDDGAAVAVHVCLAATVETTTSAACHQNEENDEPVGVGKKY